MKRWYSSTSLKYILTMDFHKMSVKLIASPNPVTRRGMGQKAGGGKREERG